MNPTPQDIALALTRAGCDRLPAPALAYISGRMGRSDLARMNLGGLRPISYGCAKPEIGAARSKCGPYPKISDPQFRMAFGVPDYEKLAAARKNWEKCHKAEGGHVLIRGATDPEIGGIGKSLGIIAALVAAFGAAAAWGMHEKKALEEKAGAVVGAANIAGLAIVPPGIDIGNAEVPIDDPAVEPVITAFPEESRHLLASGFRFRRTEVGDGGEPFDPAIIRGTVDELDEFEDLDAAARALVSVAYRAAPRAWGQIGDAEMASLGSYPIHRAKVGAADSWTYYREHAESQDVIADGIHDPKNQDSIIRAKFSEDIKAGVPIYIFRMKGVPPNRRMAVVINTTNYTDTNAPDGVEVIGGAVGATPSPIPGLPSVEDVAASVQQVVSQVAPQSAVKVDMGPRKVYPSGISPEMESTMRALVADWEGFDRLGVGSKVLPELRPAVEQFRKLRDAWKSGQQDPAVVSQEIDAATKAASQVREALAKAGVIDPALGPEAIKATQDALLAAQKAAAPAAQSWLDNVPALKWLSDPKGPKVRVEADSIVPAEWRAPIVVGIAGLTIVGAWLALSSRKGSRGAARSG